MKKFLPWLILIIFTVLVGATLIITLIEGYPIFISNSQIVVLSALSKKQNVSLVLVGDIMLDRGVEYMMEKEGKADFKFPFLKIADDLKEADILFGNLEGPISDKGDKVGSIYSFRAKPEIIEGLNYAGFNMLSLANNHAFDYGRKALEDTLTRLKNADIDYVGAGFIATETYSAVIKEIRGIKVGFLAYTNLGSPYWKSTEDSSGISWVDLDNIEKIKKDVKLAKQNSDILIVSLHSGEEYTQTPSQFQIDFSKMAIDAGADLVVGHHPHVVQKSEAYPSTGSGQVGWIFYSLGNFIFDQSFSEETMKGEIVKVFIENNKIKEVISVDIKINNFFQPEIVK